MELLYSAFFTNPIEYDSEGFAMEESVSQFVVNYFEFCKQQFPEFECEEEYEEKYNTLCFNLDIKTMAIKIAPGQYVISQYSAEENEHGDGNDNCLVENFILNDEQLFMIEELETFEHESEEFFEFISEFRKAHCAN
jgi:hypothetical protein